MKILVLGYFGYITNQIDGQTIKTRDIYSLLKDKCSDDVDYFDTQSFKVSKLNFFKLIWLIITSDIIFYLPAHNNLKFLFPIFYLLTKIFNTKLNYLVVGGWLYDFLKNKPLHRRMLGKINGIYVETDHLLSNLKKYKFNNLYKLHNFRMAEVLENHKPNLNNKEIKLVFMARIHPMKGVNLLFDIEKRLKKLDIKNVSIDIYGPIFKDYENFFLSTIESSSINYCGVIDPVNIYSVLRNYDLVLFPTKYYTEGFPGTILDAYISGVPVIASNWLNAKEFINDGETGYITEFDNDEVFINKVIYLTKNPQFIFNLKEGVENKAHQYTSEKAWEILEKTIYSDLNNIS